jgi:hypothetical protein
MRHTDGTSDVAVTFAPGKHFEHLFDHRVSAVPGVSADVQFGMPSDAAVGSTDAPRRYVAARRDFMSL